MDVHRVTARPGERLALDEGTSQSALVIGSIRRGGSIKVGHGSASLILCLRGAAGVYTTHGRFNCAARQWMLTERDWAPLIDVRDRGVAWILGWADSADDASRNRIIVPGRGRLRSSVLRRLRSLNAEIERGPGAPTLTAEKEIDHLLQILQRTEDRERLLERCPGRCHQRRVQVYARLERARMLIEGNPDRVVGISELADATHFSRWYLSRVFSSVFGLTPQAYGAEIRLRYAQQLLQQSRLSVGEVALACGFENHSAFSRAFMRLFGCRAVDSRQRDRSAASVGHGVPFPAFM